MISISDIESISRSQIARIISKVAFTRGILEAENRMNEDKDFQGEIERLKETTDILLDEVLGDEDRS